MDQNTFTASPGGTIPSLAQHTNFINSKLYLNSLLGLRQVRKYSFLSFPVLNLYLKSSYYFISSCRKKTYKSQTYYFFLLIVLILWRYSKYYQQNILRGFCLGFLIYHHSLAHSTLPLFEIFYWNFHLVRVKNDLPAIKSRRRQWHPTPVLLPGKSHGWRSLVGYSPWGCKESDTTERLHFHFSLSCTGEGSGNPLQYSCLENPREPGGLPSMGSHRVGHDLRDLAAAAAIKSSGCFSFSVLFDFHSCSVQLTIPSSVHLWHHIFLIFFLLHCPLILYFLIYFIEVWLIYNVLLISVVKHSDSVIHIYLFFFIFLSVMVCYMILTIVPCVIQ